MKKFLSYLILTCTCALSAEEFTVPSHEELQFVFEKDYLQAEDSINLLYFYASQAIEESKSSLTPDQLVEEFKKLAVTSELQEKYLSIYRSHFNADDINKISELLRNEIYMAYRQKMIIANFDCHLETKKVIEEIAQKHIASQTLTQKHREIPILNKENQEQYLNSSKPLIIDVYTDWCGPCRYMAPILEQLNEEYGDVYQFLKLNAEDERELAENIFKIEAFPTLIFIKNSQEIGRVVGFMNKDKLLSKIQHYCD